MGKSGGKGISYFGLVAMGIGCIDRKSTRLNSSHRT